MSLSYNLTPCRNEDVKGLIEALDLHPAVAGFLGARGLSDPESAERFLHPSLDQLHDPFKMLDMEKAVGRIVGALRDREKIMIHGDFDADGLTATAVLVQTIAALGGGVSHYIPNRLEEGYGLRVDGVEEAVRRGATLIITCDCGISSGEAVSFASSKGIDTIITDHHQPEGPLPEAYAILDPKRPQCPYPFKELAGVGVALKLIIALQERIGEQPPLTSLLRMGALGTVADVVPLIDENRVITHRGLSLLPGTPNIGLQALMEVAGLSDAEITANDIGFRLAPRLNTMGRFGMQDMAIDLFFTKSRSEAGKIAQQMNRLNSKRQQMVDRIFEQAVDGIEADPALLSERILVVSDNRWHKGLIGVVASKLVDAYNRPAVVITIENGQGYGSGRSIHGFHLLEALASCAEILVRFGGHAMAAGLELPAGYIPELKARLTSVARERIPEEKLRQHLAVDARIHLGDLDEKFEEQFLLLEPFGYGNPAPLFLAKDIRVVGEPRTLKGVHAKLGVEEEGKVMTALAWRMAADMSHLQAGDRLNIIFSVNINSWRGKRELQLEIREFEEVGIWE
jgi:single-stranded-DNA-specific exonuclease